MPLKLKLAPGERVYINGALMRNVGGTCEIEMINQVPLLREKDLLVESDARTPCARLYLLIQTLYLDSPEDERTYAMAAELIKAIIQAAPSTDSYFDEILLRLNKREFYHALRATQKLLAYERELLNHAK
ncbi:flagellar biosynthesis repressor FlbT [Ruficoccus amylovorans]|uniref:Flagellar biosynthesis repressor FlbT n=1 Tax=Ruficoccus amylovorans TaxID=1804625 RepID=A0A842HEH3_9BACT|nr:flagellar biosynthesis repressor FlbT [Ruficoccus amylovorans]MBC2594985.1 flagellar biosynthesis repressor FlbT [Ruficoccus amylovorans]